jgi:hypothetical protein
MAKTVIGSEPMPENKMLLYAAILINISKRDLLK